MTTKNSSIKSIDWITVVLYLILVGFGWLNIYAANTDPDSQFFFAPGKEYIKQLMWIGISFLTIGVLMLIDSKFFVEFSYIFYIITTLMLLLVIFVGVEINAAKSWFQIGSFRFQPVELAKVATALTIARVLSRFQFSFKNSSDVLLLSGIWLFPIAIIVMQNDTGSSLVFFAFLLVFFREGMTPYVLAFGLLGVIIFILTLLIPNYTILILLAAAFFGLLFFQRIKKDLLIALGIATVGYGLGALIFKTDVGAPNHDWALLTGMFLASIMLGVKGLLRRIRIIGIYLLLFWGSIAFAYSSDYLYENMLGDYQQSRILVLLNLKEDPLGAGYNVNQSKIAIGSGGFSGKGFLQGTQTKFNFVPEQSTDFIFCTVGEEWGFIGTSTVVILFLLLLMRLVFLAEQQHSSFSRIYGYGVAAIFFFHVTINIGMTIGLAPVIGIPLPFFSYGGSSLWGFSILLFIFLKLDTNRDQLIR
jgi:rod shape determining protein RodA